MSATLLRSEIGTVDYAPGTLLLNTTDDLSTLTTPGYLNHLAASSSVQIRPTDFIFASYSGGNSLFTLTLSGGTYTMVVSSGAGTITGGVSLGGQAIYAGVSGTNLRFKGLAAGSNITLTPSGTAITIASSGGGSGFAYVNSYWVSQDNGNDSNLGTSIDTPLQTFQQAIVLSASNSCIIYGVDQNQSNNETIETLNNGTSIYIVAPGTSFQGSITQAVNDLINLQANYVDAFVSNSSSNSQLSGGNFNVTTTSVGVIYANCEQYAGSHTGGGSLVLIVNELNSLTTDNSITAFVQAPFAQNISNGGTLNLTTSVPASSCITSNTGTITGMVGNVAFGGLGVSGIADTSTPQYTLTSSPPTSSGQVQMSSSAGPGASTTWGSVASGIQTSIYVSGTFGSDSTGNGTFGNPYATLANGFSQVTGSFTGVTVLDSAAYSEGLNISATGQAIYLYAPNAQLNITLQFAASQNFSITCFGLLGAGGTWIYDSGFSVNVSINVTGQLGGDINFTSGTSSLKGYAGSNAGSTFNINGDSIHLTIADYTPDPVLVGTGTVVIQALANNVFTAGTIPVYENAYGSLYSTSIAANSILVNAVSSVNQMQNASALFLDKGSGFESSNAVTVNNQSGYITTSDLSAIGPGQTYSFVLTNSILGLQGQPLILFSILDNSSNTTLGIEITYSLASSTTANINVSNTNAASNFNGTIMIGFAVL